MFSVTRYRLITILKHYFVNHPQTYYNIRMSHDPTKKYDLFRTEEAAKYYSSYTPPLAPRVINHVLRRTSEHGFLVDAGCGSGSSSRPFSDHFKSVVGILSSCSTCLVVIPVL